METPGRVPPADKPSLPTNSWCELGARRRALNLRATTSFTSSASCAPNAALSWFKEIVTTSWPEAWFASKTGTNCSRARGCRVQEERRLCGRAKLGGLGEAGIEECSGKGRRSCPKLSSRFFILFPVNLLKLSVIVL